MLINPEMERPLITLGNRPRWRRLRLSCRPCRTQAQRTYRARTGGKQSLHMNAGRSGRECRRSLQRECIDDIGLYTLEVQHGARADEEYANVRGNPMRVGLRCPSCDEQPNREQKCPWHH